MPRDPVALQRAPAFGVEERSALVGRRVQEAFQGAAADQAGMEQHAAATLATITAIESPRGAGTAASGML
jgi:hypothetical protein